MIVCHPFAAFSRVHAAPRYNMGAQEICQKISDKMHEIHMKLVARFGDEKTSKAEKIIAVLLIVIVLYVLITFMLPLVPVVLLAAILYWYFMVYKKKKAAEAEGGGTQQTVAAAVVTTAAKNPEVVKAAVSAAAASSRESKGPAPPAGAKPDVPKPWKEMVDEGTGRKYYYNTETGETCWTLPKGDHGAVSGNV